MVTKAMASGVSACPPRRLKIHGVNYSHRSACATSAHCIGNAVEQIHGQTGHRVAGGGEELCWEMACDSTRWVRCLLNTTTPRKKPPVLTTLTVTVSSSLAAAVWSG
ncbi:beta-ketoacyl synthase N-terminal-like domain-containing protein [Escherichia coli]